MERQNYLKEQKKKKKNCEIITAKKEQLNVYQSISFLFVGNDILKQLRKVRGSA